MATSTDDQNAEKAYDAAVTKAAQPVIPVAEKAPEAPKLAAPAKAPTDKVEAPAMAKRGTPVKARKSSAAPTVAKPIPSPKPAAKPRAAALAPKGMTMTEDTTKPFTAQATKFAEEAKARVETLTADMTARARTAVEKGQELTKDAAEFSRGNVEAVVEAGKIAAKGAGEIGQEVVAFTRTRFEAGQAAMQSFATVKSPTEFFQLYSEHAKAAVDAMVKHSAKTTEMSVKLATDAFQPLSSRMALAAAKLKSAA